MTGPIRERISKRLRVTFDRPLFPAKVGMGIVPWISGPGLHTRIFLNAMRDPTLIEKSFAINMTRFGPEGEPAEESEFAIGNNRVDVIDLPETADCMTYGYCWFQTDAALSQAIGLQLHFQVMADHSFAKTHGRAKGILRFGPVDLADRLIARLDPYPYRASTTLSSTPGVEQGALLLNLSDRPCRLGHNQSPANAPIMIPPHGANLLFNADIHPPAVEFFGSAPFTFYVVMRRPNGQGLTFQHIKDAY